MTAVPARPRLVPNADEFRSISWTEAVMRADERPPFLIPGRISSHNTVIYGAPNQGKTRLVASLVVSIVSNQATWLGEAFTSDVERIVICAADDGAMEQYVNLVREALPGVEPSLTFRTVKAMRTPESWAALAESVLLDRPDLVVIDPLTRVVGSSLNEDAAINAVFDGLSAFESAGVPTILVAHSSAKRYQGQLQHGPAGSFAIEANGRWFISLYQDRAGRLNLRCYGNEALAHTLVLEADGGGAGFRVVSARSGEQLLADGAERQVKRAQNTLDLNLQVAQVVVGKCQGMTVTKEIAELVGEEITHWKPVTLAKKLVPRGPVGQLLVHDGKGSWSLSDLAQGQLGQGGAA